MSNSILKLVTELTNLRIQLKTSVATQTESKRAQKNITSNEDFARSQHKIAFMRNIIRVMDERVTEIRTLLSVIPRGQGTDLVKIIGIASTSLDTLKESYQLVTSEQRELKASFNTSRFETVEALATAQRRKASNKSRINGISKSRQSFKFQYKVVSDFIYADEREKVS